MPDQSDEPAPVQAGDIGAICRRYGSRPDALIEILHDVQAALGHVPPDLLPAIAAELNLSRAEVFGTFSFYHDFHDRPPAARVLQLCRAEACQSVGCEDLARHAEARLGTVAGVELRTVYCLGNCALGPAAMLDGRLHGRLTPQRLDALLDLPAGSKAGEAAE
ncbi:NAD(P)H-dependent oxidoreductase subunit E [Marinibaculum pumilum]|uniref:NAD(P)H-dependent oxidoreductase subunit E n=1 Tax=Marinibaculum pumilum TaxID=1766165 RepID=A0ABV7L2P3_9PROT